jgi:predicted ribosomally synthesized peptide with SipW-like signal peptide
VSRVRKLLVTMLVVGVTGSLAGTGTFSAFSSTTANPGNAFTAGTVTISDNDSGSSMLSLSNAKPNDSTTGCITVTYTGSLSSNVRLYASTTGTLAPYLNLTITQGGGTPIGTSNVPFSSACTNFTPDTSGSQIFSGTLSSYASTYTNFSSGLALANLSASTTWSQNNFRVYKFVVSLANDNNAQGLNTTATFTWEADNT